MSSFRVLRVFLGQRDCMIPAKSRDLPRPMMSVFRPAAPRLPALAAAGLLGAALLAANLALATSPVVIRPFVQPGDEKSESSDAKTIVWITEPQGANYRVEFAESGGSF